MDKKEQKLSDSQLSGVSGGAGNGRKFRCPQCKQLTMMVKYKSFKCTNPNCLYVEKM